MCEAKKLTKLVLTEASSEKEKLEAMRVTKREKSKCAPEHRRDPLKSDDVIVEAVLEYKYWSYGLRTHDVPWANIREWTGKKHNGAAAYRAAKKTTTARIVELGVCRKLAAG